MDLLLGVFFASRHMRMRWPLAPFPLSSAMQKTAFCAGRGLRGGRVLVVWNYAGVQAYPGVASARALQKRRTHTHTHTHTL